MRLFFGLEDLARVRIVATLGPLAETMLALELLGRPVRRALFDPWRRQSRRRLTPDGVELARALAPAGRVSFDLFSLLGRKESLEEGLDRLAATPHRLLRAELEAVGTQHLCRWPLRDLLDHDDRQRRRAMEHTLAACHDATVRPYWPRIRARVESEAVAMARSYAGEGLEGLLVGRWPGVTWCPLVLEVSNPQCRMSCDVHLQGRGLTIVPAFFCTDPFLAAAADGSAVFLPVPTPPTMPTAAALWRPSGTGPVHELAALLGGTRAAVLAAAAPGRTTGEIARHLDISPASASQHTAVLREAGLLTSRREANTVLHTLTPTGRALLDRGLGQGAPG
ncbi:ArsR/SmtB family transcription factor [Spirillospora sp. NPDC048911]|uniref:ArsR/SmtB family transcription factor n=1 Tax=Spirillospora sp. NPDC048911 TaxID=3364527 RepID=UPI003718F9A3